jgi:cytochrome b
LSAVPDAATRMVKVWDPLVRIGHWSLVTCIAVSWATGEGGKGWHEGFGYAASAIIAIRIVWGFIGPRFARFAEFVRAPAATLTYGLRMLAGTEPRYLGHNPLGGWSIVLLIICIALTGFTGWLYTTDQYWGVKWVGELHEGLADALLVLIALHIAGVILASWRHRENLLAAMLHGRKRAENENE